MTIVSFSYDTLQMNKLYLELKSLMQVIFIGLKNNRYREKVNSVKVFAVYTSKFRKKVSRIVGDNTNNGL